MFLLDSLMISGIRWALAMTLTAAEAEMNDDTVLRDELLAAEMRREMGEISDEEFAAIEADLLARIREIKQRREGGAGPLAFGAEPVAAGDGDRFQIEASVSGDFHSPAEGAHAHVIDTEPVHESALGHLVDAHGFEQIAVIDEPPEQRAAGSRQEQRAVGSRKSAVRKRRAASATPRTPRTRTPGTRTKTR